MKPTRDNLIVDTVKKPDRSPGGVLLPEIAREKSTTGLVLAMGPGRFKDGVTTPIAGVKVGDVVLFAQYSGYEFEDRDGKTYRVLSERDVLAIS